MTHRINMTYSSTLSRFTRLLLSASLGLISTFAAAVPGQRVSFMSRDGVRLSGLLFVAPHPQALLLVTHGFQSHAGWFIAGDELADRGITTLAFDRRGSGMSGGMRGNVNSSNDFLVDMEAARDALRRYGGTELPMHLFANCFGTRVAIPFIRQHPNDFRSLILTSPATHMAARTEYAPWQKIAIFLGAPTDKFPSPLHDEEFVSSGPWLDWIKHDSLSLRVVTKGFLRESLRLHGQMMRDRFYIHTPLFVMLGSQDQMVRNDAIREKFFKPYTGEKRLIELNAEHALDFGPASAQFREELVNWVFEHSSTPAAPVAVAPAQDEAA